MCGIVAIFGGSLSKEELRKILIACSLRLRHRGPDWSGYVVEPGLGMGHERLAIVDPESGEQPLQTRDGTAVLAVNGEVYNYRELYASLDTPYEPRTGSDCEVVLPLYQQYGADPAVFLNKLRGMFAFVVYDRTKKTFLAARDHCGIIPLYIGWGTDGSVWFASEMKALATNCVTFKCFPPGHYYSSSTSSFVPWYRPGWLTARTVPDASCDLAKIRSLLTKAVDRRLMSDVPWGVLLSGGLDSSLVASIAVRLRKSMAEKQTDKNMLWFPDLHTFSIGIEGSPDLEAAQKVAEFLGSRHHSYVYTLQEGLDAIEEVVRHTETYDVTTIRASTPMYLMSRKIKAMSVKMVLSGEGADELFGGYLYFHAAPNAQEFFDETVEKVSRLHEFDCLRANKSTSAWGVEARVPFLDADFIEYVMNIDPRAKMIDRKNGRIEKYILRKAFDTPEDPYLPEEVLWRQKEQFSDGVGYGWIDALRDAAEAEVTDQMMSQAEFLYPDNTPQTKEAYRYRAIFERHYPQKSAAGTVPGGRSIACSTERALQWSEDFKGRADCSGRAVSGVHDAAYDAKWSAAGGANAAAAGGVKGPPAKRAKGPQ